VSCCRRFTYVSTANRLPLPAHATSNAISHALQLLEMNAKLSPTSANAVASVGDIWLAKKDTTKAVGYYERALAMRLDSSGRRTWCRS